MNEEKTPADLESDALRANLLETAGEVILADKYLPLLQMVEKYRGVHARLEKILYEVCHPFRNWSIIIPRLRGFVLQNFRQFKRHQSGPAAFAVFADIFFEALEESRRSPDLLSQIIEGLLAWLDKLIGSLDGDELCRFQAELNRVFDRLHRLNDDDIIMHLVQGPHPFKKLALKLAEKGGQAPGGLDYLPAARLMKTILLKNYQYWLSEEDPLPWFLERCGILFDDFHASQIFTAISHDALKKHQQTAAALPLSSPLKDLQAMLELPAHVDIVRLYKKVPAKLAESDLQQAKNGSDREELAHFSENRKLLFLFKIMDTDGLYLIHEETLREINRSLVHLVRQQSFEEIEEFLLTAFQLLEANVVKYPHTSLQCIQVLGGEVFDRNNSRMVEAFLWGVVRFGFQHASVVGVDEDWQPLVNPAHLSNIRVWLHLIMREPKWCSTLFSALIINIKLSGTCIKDTDLFQRDITELLNHPIEPIYNLAKQFTKLMPVFFNEIGSEGELRDVSTELDEIHNRKDLLIHFLRKQGHVESSNLIVYFIKAILMFWKTGEKKLLLPHLPPEIYKQVETSGPFVDQQYRLSQRVWEHFHFTVVHDYLEVDSEELADFLLEQTGIEERERRRFELLVQMLKLVFQKYNLGFQELKKELADAVRDGFPQVAGLLEVLESKDTKQVLSAVLSCLDDLKKIILSGEKFPVREDVYYKRHIAVDIPSVYGRYREKKFDALSLTFRLENLANIYLEKLPETVNLSFITQETFYNIVSCIKLFMQALRVDGISSRRLETYLSLLRSSLKIRRFSYTQYLDIFRGLSEGVKDIIYSYYTNIHQNNLSIIIPQIGAENLKPRYRSLWLEGDSVNNVHRLSEAFFRDLIAGTFGLQHLDNFIVRVIQTLESQKDTLNGDMLDLLMTYNPNKAVSPLKEVNPYTHNLIHLGNKGFNLVTLTGDNIPVPPAFIITTEVFRCRKVVFGLEQAKREFMRQVRQALAKIEQQTGSIFGSPENPLLLSVRSGGAISMPGMMSTVHNVGFNEELIAEYIEAGGNAFLSWDNYRRFLQSWAMITGGMQRDDFQMLMDKAKEKHQVRFKRQFSSEQMKELALSYQKLVRQKGIIIPDDPWLQLVNAVQLVLDSWDSSEASEYRRIMDVSDSWGTAVIVQAMVFGNKGEQSGSGVLFTSHPYRKVQRVALWGDYAYGDQGEDIVSGLVTSRAISVEQAEIDGRSVEATLERSFPEIYERLLTISRELVYEKRWNPQEIEFTFEGPSSDDLYILQTRDMITIKKKEHLSVFVETRELAASFLGQGVGVSGSALSGRAVFTEENIAQLRREDPDTPLILIRQDTVPEDIKVIHLAEGLLTSRGGQTSHASVVAVRLEKTCVVGCKQLRVYETGQYCEIGPHRISFGDEVSIDGRNGLLLLGRHQVKEEFHILPI
ncbi:MAG: phosphoenolpyruvate synthase [Deltaproteobacteria bacterium]|nr:MAG: phosphoenolpyruvate synthase [Deltaproteobacteria bacterium]